MKKVDVMTKKIDFLMKNLKNLIKKLIFDEKFKKF